MLEVNPFNSHVSACLLDYVGSGTPWQRRLWAVGSALGLREVLEGSQALQSGVLSEKAFEGLCQAVEVSACNDPGAGDKEERRLLRGCLKAPRAQGSDFLVISQLLERLDRHYLERWHKVLSEDGHSLSPERTARSIASHLLDQGFSDTFLHRWWKYRIAHQPGTRSLPDLVADAHDLVRTQAREFQILVAFTGVPGSNSKMPGNWLSAGEVSQWLRENNHDPRELRQGGGFLLRVKARDVHAAVAQVAEVVERLTARVHIGTRSRLEVVNQQVWIQGESEPLLFRRDGRGVEVRALARENQLYTDSANSNLDAALELIGSLNDGPPGPAVAGGWAAVEALLLGPGDSGDRGIAGDRLASLVACSFPRAELTALAYAHSKGTNDELAQRLGGATSNRDRALLVAQALMNGRALKLSSDSDRLAEKRMRSVLEKPKRYLRDIEGHAARALRRLYRQRNLVLHWGRMNAVCLRAALRTAAPLIGAGVDRVAHAWFVSSVSPLELAARARIRLELIETSSDISPVTLLES